MLKLIENDWRKTLTNWFQARMLEQWVLFRRPLTAVVPDTTGATEVVNCAAPARKFLQSNKELEMPDLEYYTCYVGVPVDLVLLPAVVLPEVLDRHLLPGALVLWRSADLSGEPPGKGWAKLGPYWHYVKPHAYDFDTARAEWAAPVFTSIGHFDTAKLLRESTDAEIKDTILRTEHYRYDGFDNHENKWREAEQLDTTHGKTVIDFGCGMGLEALQYAKAGNDVILADIAEANVCYAKKALEVCGYGDRVVETVVVDGSYPFFECRPYDVFHSCGVLHHTPEAGNILRRAAELLLPDGECRVMLYSEHLWPNARDANLDVTTQPGFMGFVRGRDGVGKYADWYNREKMEKVLTDAKAPLEVVREDFACRNSYVCYTLKASSQSTDTEGT